MRSDNGEVGEFHSVIDLEEEAHGGALGPASDSESRALAGVLAHLFKTTDVDFSQYRQTTVLRRIARRMSMAKVGTYAEYLAFVESDTRETEALYSDLLLSYTEFFRDPEVFEALKTQVFPALVERRSIQQPIRIWVPGCSTGQEVYSVAIAYEEFAAKSRCEIKAQIFGTDLNAGHIATARSALYSSKALAGVSAHRLAEHFEAAEAGAKVGRCIREMCVFAVQNLVQDPPLSNLDLVSCRNVLIYFDGPLQDIVLPLFHFSLRTGGYLLLGSAESVERYAHLYETVDQRANLFQKRRGRSAEPPQFPRMSLSPRFGSGQEMSIKSGSKAHGAPDIGRILDEALLSIYAPPCLLVDSSYTVRRLRGKVFDFLEPENGEASLRLPKMVGEGLMPELYVAIEEARRSGKRVVKQDVVVRRPGAVRRFDFSVVPVFEPGSTECLYLVAFDRFEDVSPDSRQSQLQEQGQDDENQTLRLELAKVREHLQTIIEEKDRVNQELWAASEEVQSTNEELQSINEEMEAAKEELESSNEELIALNEELQRKNAELLSAKDYAESLIETAKAVVVTLDENARVTSFNRFAEELTGYARSEVLGRNWFEMFIPVDERPILSTVFRESLAQMPDSAQHENPILLRSGERRLISWNNTVLRDAGGRVRGVLSVGMDVTAQRQVAAALEASEEKYRNLVETSQDLIWECDLQGRYTYLNPAWQEVFGYELHEMLGRKFTDFQTPTVAARDLEVFGKLLEGGLVKGFETVYLDKQGRELHLVFNAKFVTSPSGEVIGTRGTAHDVTARRAAERNYRSLFNSMLDGFALHEMIFDGAGRPEDYRFLAVNPSFERITGLRAEDVVGRTAKEVLPGLERQWIETYGDVVLTGKHIIFESHSADLDRHFAVTAFRPEPGKFACAFSDITERKAAEQMRLRLEQKEQQSQRLDSLGVLAGGIAHDFNNLLGGIYGFVELAGETAKDAKAQEYLDRAASTIARARGLTQQLLTFAKGGAPVRKVGHLGPFLRDTVQFALSGANISCRYDLPDDLWLCSFDKTQLAQVFENIVINAQQAMPLGGTIEIVARNQVLRDAEHPTLAAGEYVKITVKDQGVGIPENMLERIFEPFFTTKAMGHGLGLSTCYSIVHRHGGLIEAQSELGKGSAFHVWLPSTREAESVLPESAQSPHKGHGLFIVMDDEEAVRDLLEHMLRKLGYETRGAKDGEEAIAAMQEALAQNAPVAGMIFDLTIPGGTGGKQAIAEIRKLCPSVPVFVASGYSNDPVMANPQDYGFTASLCKPFRKAELSEILSAYLPAAK